jgi:excisionase family DNA binding protein
MELDAHASQSLLAPEDIARRCALSRRAVYDAIRRGEIPAMRLCGRLRVRPEDLEVWMTNATVTPPPALPQMREARKRHTATRTAGSFRSLMEEDGGERSAA